MFNDAVKKNDQIIMEELIHEFNQIVFILYNLEQVMIIIIK